MWGLPLFDIKDPAAVLFEINMARKTKPNLFVKKLLVVSLFTQLKHTHQAKSLKVSVTNLLT